MARSLDVNEYDDGRPTNPVTSFLSNDHQHIYLFQNNIQWQTSHPSVPQSYDHSGCDYGSHCRDINLFNPDLVKSGTYSYPHVISAE